MPQSYTYLTFYLLYYSRIVLLEDKKMFEYFNPNPRNSQIIGDCTVRAVSKALDITWNNAFIDLVLQAYILADMPSSNAVLDKYLTANGFRKYVNDSSCPDCYTVKDFADDHPKGTYILGTGTHVVTVIDGVYYDSLDSGDASPQYYYKKES